MTRPIDFGETGMSYADAAMRPSSKGIPQTQPTAQLDVEALVGRKTHEDWTEVLSDVFYIRWTRGPDYERAYLCVDDGEPDTCDFAIVPFGQAELFKAALLAHIAGEDARVAAAVAGERKRCALLGFDHAEMWRERRDEPGYDQVIAAAAWDATHDLAAAIRETPSAE